MTTGAGNRPAFGYTLRVKGRLDSRWAAWFDGFTLTGETDGTTTLTGAVADQAHLHALLTKIRDLGITLISLEATPDQPTAVRRERGFVPVHRLKARENAVGSEKPTR